MAFPFRPTFQIAWNEPCKFVACLGHEVTARGTEGHLPQWNAMRKLGCCTGLQALYTRILAPLSSPRNQIVAAKRKSGSSSKDARHMMAHQAALALPLPMFLSRNDHTAMVTAKAAPTQPQNHSTCAGHGFGNMPRPNFTTTAVSTTASDTYSHAKKPNFLGRQRSTDGQCRGSSRAADFLLLVKMQAMTRFQSGTSLDTGGIILDHITSH